MALLKLWRTKLGALLCKPESGAVSTIMAAGGIITRHGEGGGKEILIVKKRRGDWTLPKGKLAPNESFQEAALREVREETGCSCTLGEYLGPMGYTVKGTPKVVLFWYMSVVDEGPIAPNPEIEKKEWVSLPAALERLDHEKEREFLERQEGASAPYDHFVNPGLPEPKYRHVPFLWKRARSRLFADLHQFRVELQFLKQRNPQRDLAWSKAADDHLSNVDDFLRKNDVESAWPCLHAARRVALYGLDRAEILNRARLLRLESEKVLSWRGQAMRDLLAIRDDEVGVIHVADAMRERDEYAANEYHKLWLISDQLGLILTICGLSSAAFFIYLCWICPHVAHGSPNWSCRKIAQILLLGLLGGSFSAAKSLINASARIPQQFANFFVTVTRIVFGAVAGLAGYAFWDSGVINVTFGKPDAYSLSLAIAFAFGYAGDRMIAPVVGSLEKKIEPEKEKSSAKTR